jgi:hypothetical protein
MNTNERDKWDDLFRLKLHDMEINTMPEDWEAINKRLPEAKTVTFRKRWTYWAAAVIAALIIGGGSIYLARHADVDTNTFVAQPITTPAVPSTPSSPTLIAAVTAKPLHQPTAGKNVSREAPATTTETPTEIQDETPTETAEETPAETEIAPPILIADAAPILIDATAAPPRKWSFGAGIGGLTQNSAEVVNTYVLRSSSKLEDEELLTLNAAPDQNQGKLPRTNIKHKLPLSFGLSVSRRLSNHLSLQTGLVYSLLISDWETEASAYNTKTRQTLHFVGIPLSLSLKIAEWRRFMLYASTGALMQVNVAGQLKVRRFSDDLQTEVYFEDRRMREWQYSVNAQAGITYPIFPYVSAFAEIGAAYYFDNESEIETIYSDKPFNISPQIGLRLNF